MSSTEDIVCSVFVKDLKLFFFPSKNYLSIWTRLFQNLKGRILNSIIPRSEMG